MSKTADSASFLLACCFSRVMEKRDVPFLNSSQKISEKIRKWAHSFPGNDGLGKIGSFLPLLDNWVEEMNAPLLKLQWLDETVVTGRKNVG